jgi:hypothetical protein
VPTLPPAWHRHMMHPLFSRCSVLPLLCSPQTLLLLEAGRASISALIVSPSEHSYPASTLVVVSSEIYNANVSEHPMILLLASFGLSVVFSTFFEDWARLAAPPPRVHYEVPEAVAAAAKTSAAATSAIEAPVDSGRHVADDASGSSVFRHTDKKNSKCSICRGPPLQGSTAMHIVEITDTSTSGHLACFQWLCGTLYPSLAVVQVLSACLVFRDRSSN